MGETIKFDNKIVVNVKEETKSCKYFILTNDLFRGIGKSLLIVTQKMEKRVRNFVVGWHVINYCRDEKQYMANLYWKPDSILFIFFMSKYTYF